MTHYLCGQCGELSKSANWLAFRWDDQGENLLAAGSQDSDPLIRCPICEYDHKDADDDPGVWMGTRLEMENERRQVVETLGDFWLDYWKDRAARAERQRDGNAKQIKDQVRRKRATRFHSELFRLCVKDLLKALEQVEMNDKTTYTYSGADSFNRDGRKSNSGRWATPAEIARAAILRAQKSTKATSDGRY